MRPAGLIILVVTLYWLGGLRPVGYPLSLALLVCAGVTAARVLLRPRSWLDLGLAGWTAGVAALLLIAEALSLLKLLGSPVAWMVASGAAAILANVAAALRPTPWPRTPWLQGRPRLMLDLPWWGWIWLCAFLILLLTAFTLTWFAGIMVDDTLTAYLPRSIRYLQNGTFNVYATLLDTTPYLHQALIAHQLVFLRSDALVNPLSFMAVLSISAALYAFTRSLHWHGYLPLLTACLPFTIPIVLMHASTSNFDTLETSWLVLCLYFLRRGAPGLTVRWLLFAALALALGLATKSTFFFAAPGLGLVWLAVAVRSLRRRGLGQTARWVALAAVIALLVGAPYLIRNTLLQGAPLGVDTVGANEYVLGPPVTLVERGQRVLFTMLAITVEFLTPPFLFGSYANEPANAWFKALATALGYQLPDARWSFYGSWDAILRHGLERYASGHAFFGAAFLLVLVPAMLTLVVRWRALGARRVILAACLLVGLTYPVVMTSLFRYDVSIGRYLIEMVAILTVLAPVIFWALPRKLAVCYALLVSTVALAEMRDVILNNRQMRIGSVTVTPREEQYYREFGLDSAASLTAARAFKQKYPASEFPQVYIDVRISPQVHDYAFLGPALDRRTTYWRPAVDPAPPPGPLLTSDPGLVETLARRPDMSIDRLSLNTWVILPNDRLRVVYSVERTAGASPLTLKVHTAVPPAYERPEYRYVVREGGAERVIQEFSANADVEIPFDTLITVRIEARDTSGRQPPLTYTLDPRRYLDL